MRVTASKNPAFPPVVLEAAHQTSILHSPLLLLLLLLLLFFKKTSRQHSAKLAIHPQFIIQWESGGKTEVASTKALEEDHNITEAEVWRGENKMVII